MLATLLISLSVAVPVLLLVDFLLSKDQKTWLSDVVLKMWNVLDEAKGWSFGDWLKNPRAVWWFFVSLALLISVTQLYIPLFMMREIKEETGSELSGLELLLMFFGMAILGVIMLLAARLILARLLQFTSTKQLSRRLATVFLLAAISYLPLVIAVDKLLTGSTASKAIAFGILFFLVTPIFVALLCVLAIFLSLALAYVASAILYVGELVVRRIAEYPKGPVLALSALVGGIVALIKAFGYHGAQ